VLGLLFDGTPLVSRLFLGSWGFDGPSAMAGLCLVTAAYLYCAGRESRPPIPDSAATLDEAVGLAASGDAGQGTALLNEAIRLAPDEPDLYMIRSHAFTLLGKESSARRSGDRRPTGGGIGWTVAEIFLAGGRRPAARDRYR
jgi:hypothetical protein